MSPPPAVSGGARVPVSGCPLWVPVSPLPVVIAPCRVLVINHVVAWFRQDGRPSLADTHQVVQSDRLDHLAA